MSITILIPAYNQAAYLAQAVESVFQQTLLPEQVIVINDGSTDDTARVVKELQSHYSSLQYLAGANQGVCLACQQGLKKVESSFVLRLDADDYLPPQYLKLLSRALAASSPKVAYAYADSQYVGAREGRFIAGDYSLARLVRENYINVAALVRTEAARQVGYFNPTMRHGYEDWDLWLALAEQGYAGVYCPETFLYYRQKEQGRNQMKDEQHKAMIRQVYENHPRLFKQPINQWRVFSWRVKRKLSSYSHSRRQS